METIRCVKLGQELPALNLEDADQARQYKMILLIAGPEFAERVKREVSAQAVAQWNDHMLMVMNEYRLDPTSEESNQVLAQHMEPFFFGEQKNIPGFVPEGQ